MNGFFCLAKSWFNFQLSSLIFGYFYKGINCLCYSIQNFCANPIFFKKLAVLSINYHAITCRIYQKIIRKNYRTRFLSSTFEISFDIWLSLDSAKFKLGLLPQLMIHHSPTILKNVFCNHFAIRIQKHLSHPVQQKPKVIHKIPCTTTSWISHTHSLFTSGFHS